MLLLLLCISPVTPLSPSPVGCARLLTAVWMAIGFVSLACILGAVTSSLTTLELETAILHGDGLKGKRVCIDDWYAGILAGEYGAIEVICPSSPECPKNAKNGPYGQTGYYYAQCLELLDSDNVDAMVAEHAQLSALRVQTSELSKFSIGPLLMPLLQSGWVGPNSVITKQFNWAIAKVVQDRAIYDGVQNKWFGDPEKGVVENAQPEEFSTGWLVSCCVLWSVFFILQLSSSFLPWNDAMLKYLGRGPGGMVHFVFGTPDERSQYKELNQSDSSKCDCLPGTCFPKSSEAVVPETKTQDRHDIKLPSVTEGSEVHEF